jgi:glutathione peroxidase
MHSISLLAVLLTVLILGPHAVAAESQTGSAHDFSFSAIDGEKLNLSDYRGKVVLVVNTASFCGYTPQYDGLQTLWERYRDKGLVVLGVPSNDFGGQEPKSEGEILGFCQGKYGVSFPLTAKMTVRGTDAHPFYRWAGQVLGDEAKPKWNFHKYLVSADGRLVGWFSTPTKPLSPQVTQAIDAEIASANSSKRPANKPASGS